MGQTEDFGLQPPGTAEETANETAQTTTSLTAGSGAGGAADRLVGDCGPSATGDHAAEDGWRDEPDIPGDLSDETDGRRPATGEARVDEALARLDELDGLPVTEHRAVFEDVHERLRDVLGELDTGQPRGAGPAAGAAGRPGR